MNTNFQTRLLSNTEFPVLNLPLPKLELGERQDIVSLDAKDRIVGFGRIHNSGAAGVIHYDASGEPLSRTLQTGDGWTLLLDAHGNRLGEMNRRDDRTCGYFDAGGDLRGEARLRNDNFVEYFDRFGVKIGIALIEPHRVRFMDALGRSLGRKFAREATGRWLAMEDAWDVFAARAMAWAVA